MDKDKADDLIRTYDIMTGSPYDKQSEEKIKELTERLRKATTPAIDVKIVNDSNNPLPKYAHDGDSGVDLYADSEHVIYPRTFEFVKTNIKFEIPYGYEIQVRSRSGLARKNGVFVLNSPGTLDSTYRGTVGIILFNAGQLPFEIKIGDRVAQAVLMPVCKMNLIEVKELSETDRNEGGFGSTGVK
jgi:dUTP pyrophosphatase